MSPLSLSSQVRISPDVLVQEIAGELVMLDLAQEKYFGLDPVGTRIWQLLGTTARLDEVHARLLDEYEVRAEKLEADLLGLVESLARLGMVEVVSK